MKRRKKNKKSNKNLMILIGILLAVSFFLLINFKPQVSTFSINSPENITYDDGDIFLSVSSNRLMVWMNDSLDGENLKNQCTFCYDFRIDGYKLKPGTHSYSVDAMTEDGIILSQTVVFTVK
ncbi:MAG: hypothetical protein J4452_00300 [Candidatus Aenigmarchaeota archaeon]|nr:hypothetical protein [Candidatus Aenigmarchaeota archaeon]